MIQDRRWLPALAVYFYLNITSGRTTCWHIRQGIKFLGPLGPSVFALALVAFYRHVMRPLKKEASCG